MQFLCSLIIIGQGPARLVGTVLVSLCFIELFKFHGFAISASFGLFLLAAMNESCVFFYRNIYE